MSNYVKYIRNMVGNNPIILVGCGVLVCRGSKILLHRRVDNGMWATFGGCMEMGETSEETARRELFEETGLTAGKLEFLGIFSGSDMFYTYPNGDQVHCVCIEYICTDFAGEMSPQADEVLEFRWFDINKLPPNINPTNKPALAALKEKIC
ncbi:MAG: NUDIX hydrolase [Defluviitaleaceae bacterium]|nr:NUDIX hydrolase [Defluviitaleaceae bacterium]